MGTIGLDTLESPRGVAERVLGGSATYAALSALFFEQEVRLVAVVGNDFPEDYANLLRNSGIRLDGLQVDRTEKTFAWGGRYSDDPNQRVTTFTDLNALANFSAAIPPVFQSSRIICLANIDPKLQLHVLDQVENPALTVCDTMNYWINHTPELLRKVLERIDCLIINDEEALQLTEEHNLVRAGKRLLALGPEIIVIKKGEHGAIMITEDSFFIAPVYPTETVVDTTGAGDTFLGAFCGHISTESHINHMALSRAVLCGTVLGSVVVEHTGPQGLLDLNDEKIQSRMEFLRQVSAWPS